MIKKLNVDSFKNLHQYVFTEENEVELKPLFYSGKFYASVGDFILRNTEDNYQIDLHQGEQTDLLIGNWSISALKGSNGILFSQPSYIDGNIEINKILQSKNDHFTIRSEPYDIVYMVAGNMTLASTDKKLELMPGDVVSIESKFLRAKPHEDVIFLHVRYI